MPKGSYDPACAVLAAHFLPDDATPEAIAVLAQTIQDCVEAAGAERDLLVVHTTIRHDERE
jgi:hypothetical protein